MSNDKKQISNKEKYKKKATIKKPVLIGEKGK